MNKNIKKQPKVATQSEIITKKLLANLINKIDIKTISIKKPVCFKENKPMKKQNDSAFKFTKLTNGHIVGIYDYNDLYEELEEFEELNKNIRKQPEAAAQPEPVKTIGHFGVYIDGVVNCTACGSDEEQFKCSNYRQRTNGFGCSFLFNLKDCMSIDVQQQIRDKN